MVGGYSDSKQQSRELNKQMLKLTLDPRLTKTSGDVAETKEFLIDGSDEDTKTSTTTLLQD